MTLTSWQYDDHPLRPGVGCQGEDDKDRRWYSGWLAAGESFSTTTRFCSSDGNTGAFLWLDGDTHYRVDWWLETATEVWPLHPVLTFTKTSGRGHDTWEGCEAQVPGTVFLTITNVGRGAYTVLGTGSQWHDTFGVFYYECP